ncbi:MAG: thioredoxin family protein [Candidatus Riflebacteria bacterium]|nr:thioredoxin family protein [Candidatus Riflebacteria bacterium]
MSARAVLVTSLIACFGAVELEAGSLSCSATGKKGKDGWTVTFHPPRGHHFSKGPGSRASYGLSGGRQGSAVELQLAETVASALLPGDAAEVSAHLLVCDDANTMCVPASGRFILSEGALASAPSPDPQASGPPGPAAGPAGAARPAARGFLVDEPQRALDRAAREDRPLLIDFFGIWCPPCNMLDEVVFSAPAFVRATERFVKLKLDADRESSWSLKERYRVGGYPTVVFATSRGEEVGRFVGFRPPGEVVALAREALARIADQDRSRAAPAAADPAALLRKARLHLQRQEFREARSILEPLHEERRGSGSRALELTLWEARVGCAREAVKEAAGLQRYPSIVEACRDNLVRVLEDAVARFPDAAQVLEWGPTLAGLHGDRTSKRGVAGAWRAVERAAVALGHSPGALAAAGLNRADLWTCRAEARAGTGDPQGAREAYLKAAEEYGRAIRQHGASPDRERGFNLERAYCLRRAGKLDEALALYRKLEAAYPDEFTFYFAHAGLLRETNDLPGAETVGRKALERSYGDNRLRCVELVGTVLKTQGKLVQARQLVRGVVDGIKLPADAGNRTHRYHKALVKLLKELDAAR